jgi:hypothetical protein
MAPFELVALTPYSCPYGIKRTRLVAELANLASGSQRRGSTYACELTRWRSGSLSHLTRFRGREAPTGREAFAILKAG